mmetsp:Transcript_40000/g.81898  ORF Transcript_40000/g.81898 Transcript_40000/m.81898 type:complete len:201 (+) Transcript_40000:467-1069(+)
MRVDEGGSKTGFVLQRLALHSTQRRDELCVRDPHTDEVRGSFKLARVLKLLLTMLPLLLLHVEVGVGGVRHGCVVHFPSGIRFQLVLEEGSMKLTLAHDVFESFPADGPEHVVEPRAFVPDDLLLHFEVDDSMLWDGRFSVGQRPEVAPIEFVEWPFQDSKKAVYVANRHERGRNFGVPEDSVDYIFSSLHGRLLPSDVK